MPTASATKPRRAHLRDARSRVDTTRLGGSATGPKLQPTAVVGEPYPFPPPPPVQPNLNVPEPAALVGLNSGQQYATLGDNPMGPETMSVQPPLGTPVEPGFPGQVLAPGAADISLGRELGPVSMADGGSATIGRPIYDPNQAQGLQQGVRQQQRSVLGAQEGVLGAREAAFPAQQAALQAQRNVLPYSQAVLGARQATMPARQAVIGANRAVLGARTGSLAAQRGYIGQQQGANAAELTDINAIRAARANTPDIIAVAQERQLRNQVDRSLYNRIGVEAPLEVAVEPGQEGSLPPNMRAALQTQADIKRTQAKDNAELRQNQLAAARLAVDLIDTNVTEAQIAASEAGLTLDQAQMLVDQAQIAEGGAQLGARAAGYDVEEANLGVDRAQLGESRARLGENRARLELDEYGDPSDLGWELYTDPVTLQREWLTPDEANERQFQYGLGRSRQEYPSRYDFNEYQEQYGTGQEIARGGPLGGMQSDDLINYWVESAMYFAPTSRANYQQEVEQAIIGANPGDPQRAATEIARVRTAALARMAAIRKAEEEAAEKNGGGYQPGGYGGGPPVQAPLPGQTPRPGITPTPSSRPGWGATPTPRPR